MFLGQYEHTIDDKGRLTIPARYRDLLPDGAYVTVSGVSSEAVVKHLTSCGIIPSEVGQARPDLESLFLELTQTLN